jgi:hypothetical protein
VTREPIDEVVLAAMRLVGNNHDVAALGEDRMSISLLLREEFLNSSEYDTAGCDREFCAQVSAIRCLRRGWSQ